MGEQYFSDFDTFLEWFTTIDSDPVDSWRVSFIPETPFSEPQFELSVQKNDGSDLDSSHIFFVEARHEALIDRIRTFTDLLPRLSALAGERP